MEADGERTEEAGQAVAKGLRKVDRSVSDSM
jgi:hypothetical protein